MPAQALSAGADGFTTFEDQQAFIASLRFFVWDEWRWPLMRAAGLGGETGTSLVFTDSIPVYALALRLARLAIGPDFNFIGVWLGLCYALQGLCAVAAVRMWGLTGWMPNLAAALLAVSLPAWIVRVAHPSLTFHAILLLAIGSYGWAERSRDPRLPLASSVLLCWTAIALNPYLFVMVATSSAALLLRLWGRGWRLLTLAVVVAVLVGGTALEMWVLGFFEPHGGGAGFGIFSMNLLSPVYPDRSALLHRAFRPLDATGGQYEGYNYLGLGLLALASVATWVVRGRWRSLVARHWSLAVAAVGLTAWALSHRVYCGRQLVLALPPPPDLLSQFRSSGRFFWPVAYLILIGAVVVIGRRGRRLGLVLMAAAALQWVDTARMRKVVTKVVSSVPAAAFDRAAWTPALAAHRRVVVAPGWDCAQDAERRQVGEIVYLASIPRTTVMTVYTSRPLGVDCAREAAAFDAGEGIDRDTLVVALDSAGLVYAKKLDDWYCVRFPGGRACSALPSARGLLVAIGRPDNRLGSGDGLLEDGFETGNTMHWSTQRP